MRSRAAASRLAHERELVSVRERERVRVWSAARHGRRTHKGESTRTDEGGASVAMGTAAITTSLARSPSAGVPLSFKQQVHIRQRVRVAHGGRVSGGRKGAFASAFGRLPLRHVRTLSLSLFPTRSLAPVPHLSCVALVLFQESCGLSHAVVWRTRLSHEWERRPRSLSPMSSPSSLRRCARSTPPPLITVSGVFQTW
jgi:hypothetical protein